MTNYVHTLQNLGIKLNQDLWRRRLAKGVTLDPQSLQYSDFSARQSEELVKLLQLVAGDVETNPGPSVSAFFANIYQFMNVFLGPEQAASFG